MEYEFIRYHKDGRIAYVTINRPASLNALHPDASREMLEIWTDFRNDPDMWVAILQGEGDRAFCAGFDLKYRVANERSQIDPPIPFGGITYGFECWKPIIAAVNGYALGGGLELMLACDIVVASEHAELGLPEPRLGFPPGAGGPQHLIRQIPSKHAMGMLLTGRRITATEALGFGLVNEVVPYSELETTAERWANEVLRCAPLGVQAAKQMALEGAHLPYEESISRSYDMHDAVKESIDYLEGPRAFVEKRKPTWTGM